MHRHRWLCTCNQSFETSEKFVKHLHREHAGTFIDNQLPALMARAQVPVKWIPASACPLCDYESALRQRHPSQGTDPRDAEPILVKVQNFRSHLGRHLEQLALFVLPRNEVDEQLDGNADAEPESDEEEVIPENQLEIAIEANLEHGSDDRSSHGLSSDVEAAIPEPFEHDQANPKPVNEPQSHSDSLLSKVATHHNRVGFDGKTEVKTEDEITESTGFPDLAMGWQPPMDFWPPEKDFEQEDTDWIPRREEPMFGGDLFTPGWVRGHDSQKQGFCGRCQPGTWHNIEDSSYQLDLTYHHGIATSGIPLPRPSSIRERSGNAGVWEGYCDTCKVWQVLQRTTRGWNWFSHCIKVSGVGPIISTVGDPNIAKELGLTGTRNVPEKHEPGVMKRADDIIASDASAPEMTDIPPPNISPFLMAVDQGNHGVVISLINQGADVEELSWEGRTALMISASNGSLDVITTLLCAGANVNATSEKGWTALMVTIKNADSKTADLLLQNGADVNHLSPDWWTALAEATNQGHTALMEKLLEYGADPETKSSHDWTPLMHAAYRGDQVGVRLLLDAGANVNGSSQRDETALLLAAAGGHTEIVRTLLEAGAAAEPYWVTLPLEKAGEGGEVETSARGTYTDGGGPEERAVALGWTPLMLACQTGSEEMVRMLLDRGVSMEPRSPYGKRAIDIARENAKMRVVELLMKNAAKRNGIGAQE